MSHWLSAALLASSIALSTGRCSDLSSCAAEPFAAATMVLIDPIHKLAFCDIPKNADHGFRNMMCSLAKGHTPYENVSYLDPDWEDDDHDAGSAYHNQYEVGCSPFHAMRVVSEAYSEEFSEELPGRPAASTAGTPFTRKGLRDMMWGRSGWLKAAFIRDPLDKFGSAWQSKCTPDGDSDGYQQCGLTFNETSWYLGYADNASFGYWTFDDAVDVVYRHLRHGGDVPPSSIYQFQEDPMHPSDDPTFPAVAKSGLLATFPWPLDHVRKQSEMCEGLMWTSRGAMDRIYMLTHDTAYANVIDMLKHATDVPYPQAQPSVLHAFPPPGVETSATAGRSRSSTPVPWTADVAQKLLVAYAPDYLNFDLAVPPKYVELAGEDYVQGLGLRTTGVKCGVCAAADPASSTAYEEVARSKRHRSARG